MYYQDTNNDTFCQHIRASSAQVQSKSLGLRESPGCLSRHLSHCLHCCCGPKGGLISSAKCSEAVGEGYLQPFDSFACWERSKARKKGNITTRGFGHGLRDRWMQIKNAVRPQTWRYLLSNGRACSSLFNFCKAEELKNTIGSRFSQSRR